MRPKKPALPTSSPATSGTICGGVSPVVMTSCGDFLALGDRRHERAFVADLDLDRAAGEAGGNGNREIARGDQRHFAALPSWTLAVPTLAPAWNKGLADQAPKPHWISRVDSWTRAFQLGRPASDLDQPAAVLIGRAGEAIARFVGVAGLEAVRARRHCRGSGCGSACVMSWPEPSVLPQVKLGSE